MTSCSVAVYFKTCYLKNLYFGHQHGLVSCLQSYSCQQIGLPAAKDCEQEAGEESSHRTDVPDDRVAGVDDGADDDGDSDDGTDTRVDTCKRNRVAKRKRGGGGGGATGVMPPKLLVNFPFNLRCYVLLGCRVKM